MKTATESKGKPAAKASNRKLLGKIPRGCFLVLSGAFWCFPLLSLHAQKLGISSRFGDVVVRRIQPGEIYNLKAIKNVPYVVSNLSEAPMDVKLEIVPPLEGTLKEGYEVLPSMDWVKIVPDRLKLGPKESGSSEILISVPKDPKWKDRSYQCAIYAHSANPGFLNVGIYDKLYLSTGDGPLSRKKSFDVPNFEIEPLTMRLSEVDLGRKVDVKKEYRTVLRIVNKSDSRFKVRITRASFGGSQPLPAGYEAGPDTLPWAYWRKETVKVKSNRIVEVPLVLHLPKDAHGRQIAYLFKAEMVDSPVAVESYIKVLVSARKSP